MEFVAANAGPNSINRINVPETSTVWQALAGEPLIKFEAGPDDIQERIAGYLRKLAEMERYECRGNEARKPEKIQKASGEEPMHHALLCRRTW